MMKSIIKYIVLWLVGGCTYYMIEVIWRGYSHPSMVVLGGICFVCVGLLNNVLPWSMHIEYQAGIGAAIITLLEFITGCIVNSILKWDVWDYSELPLNVLGQICLPFSLIWFVLSIAIILLDDYIRYKWFHEQKPKYTSAILQLINR